MRSPSWLIFVSLLIFGASHPLEDGSESVKEDDNKKPEVKSLHVDSTIKYRYATTLISSRVTNPSNVAKEYVFHVVLPEDAFITRFVMTIDGKDYEAYVKEKEEAKKTYDQAVSLGLSAAHVAYNARDSNDFKVNINIKPEEKVTFNLTYEDLLSRQVGRYEHKVNINPGQIVDDLKVTVNVEDAYPLTKLQVPEFRTTNEISAYDKDNKDAVIERVDPKRAVVTWQPSSTEQRQLASEGLQGQFSFRYDVDRTNPNQILVNDGYFVHYFSADDLTPLSKYVIFVLDVSGSMHGTKLKQLKEAMNKILSDLKPTDKFSIVTFESHAEVAVPPLSEGRGIKKVTADSIFPVNERSVAMAKTWVDKLDDRGGTNIIGGLRLGMQLAELGDKELPAETNQATGPQPTVIFLTDGEPNIEESDPAKICDITADLNQGRYPIYSLGFGDGADIKFLRNLSLGNHGFARSIYEASDAALQLQEFFKLLSSPVLSKVQFEYLPGQVDKESTKMDFFKLYTGGELVVSGKLNDASTTELEGSLSAYSTQGEQRFVIPRAVVIDVVPKPPEQNKTHFGPLEKLWAYKSIKQLLDNHTLTKSPEAKQKALDLALKYSFVTPLTSLVVVKPDSSSDVPVEKVGSRVSGPPYGAAFPSSRRTGMSASSARRTGPAYGQRTLTTSYLRSNHRPFGGMAYAIGAPHFLAASRPMMLPHGIDLASGPGFAYSGFQDSSAPGLMSSAYAGPGNFVLSTTTSAMMTSPTNSEVAMIPDTTEEVDTTTKNTTDWNLSKVDWETVDWLREASQEKDKGQVAAPPEVAFSPEHSLLALNQSLEVEGEACQKTVDSALTYTGQCIHLVNCMFEYLATNVTVYPELACTISPNFAGVCCPDTFLTRNRQQPSTQT